MEAAGPESESQEVARLSYAAIDPLAHAIRRKRFGLCSLIVAILTLAFCVWPILVNLQLWRLIENDLNYLPTLIAEMAKKKQQEQVRVAAAQQWLQIQAAKPPLRGLNQGEIDAVVSRIKPAPVTDLQLEPLIEQLRKPGQQLVDPKLPLVDQVALSNQTIEIKRYPREFYLRFIRSDAQGMQTSFNVNLFDDGALRLNGPYYQANEVIENAKSWSFRPPSPTAIATQRIRQRRAIGAAAVPTLIGLLAVALATAGLRALQGDKTWWAWHRFWAIAQSISVATALAGALGSRIDLYGIANGPLIGFAGVTLLETMYAALLLYAGRSLAEP